MLTYEERKKFNELKRYGLFKTEEEFEHILNVEKEKNDGSRVYKTEKVLTKTKNPNKR